MRRRPYRIQRGSIRKKIPRRHRGDGGGGVGGDENSPVKPRPFQNAASQRVRRVLFCRRDAGAPRLEGPFGFPRGSRKRAVDHQTAMTPPPAVRRTNMGLTSRSRRHQRRKTTGAITTVQAPAKMDDKRCRGGDLIHMVNRMAPVFSRRGPASSTIAAISLAQMGHAMGP